MREITSQDFNNKRALVRVDFNVPLNNELEITDTTRIEAAIPTINHILASGGSIVLISHLGRPKNGPETQFSLAPVAKKLAELLQKDVQFVDDCIGEEATKVTKNLTPGSIVLLENLRFYAEEKSGDSAFAQQLAQHGDVYVNDAFGTAHRAHASTAIIAQFFDGKKCFGLLLAKEIKSLNRLLLHPESPTLAIIGGAKVSSKIGIIENLIDRMDHIIVGGGMAYTFIKAVGGNIGNSLVEDEFIDTALQVLQKAKEKSTAIHLPVDTIVADAFKNDANSKAVDIKNIEDKWMGLDIADASIKAFDNIIKASNTILWNGPMGVFEMPNFSRGTKAIAQSIAKATENGAFSLIGGGDSVAAINQLGMSDKVSYVSTGGGAMLEYLEGKTLPGIAAIES